MMRPYTVVHQILVRDLENPFKPRKTILKVAYADSVTKRLVFLSNRGEAPLTSDQMVPRLFDLSLKGYYVHEVSTYAYWPGQEYTIVLRLGLSKCMKSNIDDSVVNLVSGMLDSREL